MSVVERFKGREIVRPVYTLIMESGLILKVARIGKVELERAGKIARKESGEEGLDFATMQGAEVTYTYMGALGKVLLDHIKGWEGIELPFTSANLSELISEFAYEERVELGLKYFHYKEVKDDDQKKMLEIYIQNLSQVSKLDSTTNSESQNSLAPDVLKPSQEPTGNHSAGLSPAPMTSLN